MKITYFFVMISCLFFLSVSWATQRSTEEDIADKSFSFSLPVNVALSPHIFLVVNIPEGYRPLQSMQAMVKNTSNIMEFVPKDNSDDGWTNIITLSPLIGLKVKSSEFVSQLKQGFLSNASNVEILENTVNQYPGYEKSCLGVDYEVKSRHEMVYMCYYSGPYDCVGMQYAVVWPAESITKKALLEKLKKFVNDQSQIKSE